METEKNTFTGWTKAALILAVILLLTGGGWFYRFQEQTIREKVEQDLTAIAHLKADQIAKWRNDQLADAAAIMADRFIAQSAIRFLTTPNADHREDLLARFHNLANQHDYTDILLVNPSGDILLSLNDPACAHPEFLTAIAESLRKKRPVLLDFHTETQYPIPHISMVAPLFSGDEQVRNPRGAFIMVTDAEEFLYPLIQFWPTPSKTAETLLVRRDKDHVLFLNNLRHQPDTALKLRIPLSRADLPARMAVSGRKGIVPGKDYRGVDVISVILPIPDSPWFMVTKVDSAEVFAEWRLQSVLILLLLCGLTACLGILGLVLRQREKKIHYRSLYLAEASLRENMERHSTTLKAIGDAVIATDIQGRVELINPVAEALTGWTDAEARGRSLAEIFHIINEHTREKAEDPVEKVLREGTVVDIANHTLLIARDGTERPIADSGAPIRNEDGEITGVVMVFRDQSEQRLNTRMTEIRLSLIEYAATHTLGDLLTRALDAISELVDSPIGFFHFMEADQKTLSLQQWSSRTLTEFCHATGKGLHYSMEQAGVWADCARLKKPVIHNDYAALENKKGLPEGHAHVIRELVVPVMRKDKVVAILGVGNKPVDYAGMDVKIVSFLSDVVWEIVQRKQADTERERLLSAIEQAGESIVITDPKGNIQYVNPAFERMTGYSRAEAMGQNPRILKSGEQDSAFYQKLWETISSGRIWEGRLVNKRKDGTFFTEDVIISPVRDSEGRTISYVAVKRDITEHLRLSAHLQQAQKMESVGRLAGGVAHDYNNMLGVILGYTELIMDKIDPNDPLQADLTEIMNAAGRSRAITRQLMAFARKQTISPKVIDLNETVEGMLKMLRHLIGEDIALSWRPRPGLWPVKMDPAQIDQILANLVVNARDAIVLPSASVTGQIKTPRPGGGVGNVTILTDAVTFDDAYCAQHPGFIPGDFTLLAVSDDGCGMDKQTLGNIFEPFFTTKDIDQGTGMGLATVYGIVKQNNGFINVYSEPEKGSVFRIYLPRHAGEALQVKAKTEEPIPVGSGETILIVEDEQIILTMTTLMLEKLGYRVLGASTPDTALRLAEENAGRIGLLITDVIMPEMNGRELAERLHALYPKIKILFMSGYTADVIAHRGVIDQGVNFIQKPFSMKDLGRKVREAINGKGK